MCSEPHRWRKPARRSSVTRGWRARLPTAPAGPELVGERVVYDRTTVVETFDLRPEGIEQRWRFDALPARGAIELELAVDTDLEITAEATGHRFGSPSAGIHYGRATAIDAMSANFRLVVASDCVGDRALGPHEANLFDIGQKYGDLLTAHAIMETLATRAAA